MNKGILFIISGPSGSGKDTVLNEVFKRLPELKFSISAITRPMREGETPDGKYRFITCGEFEKLIENDELLEHNVFVDNYYGTPKKYVLDNLNSGKNVIVEVDVNGARQIKEKMPESVSIFILPPSFEVLKSRLSGRGTEKAEVLEKRLNAALFEIAEAKKYDYTVINDDLFTAVSDVVSIIRTSELRAENNIDIINSILKQ